MNSAWRYRYLAFLSCALSLLAFWVVLSYLIFGPVLSIELEANVDSYLEVYWNDSKKGYNAQQVITHPVSANDKSAVKVPIATWLPKSLRIDPINVIGNVNIFQISLSTPLREIVWNKENAFKDWKALADIDNFKFDGDKLLINASGKDPYFDNNNLQLRQELLLLLALLVFLCLLSWWSLRKVRSDITQISQSLSQLFAKPAFQFCPLLLFVLLLVFAFSFFAGTRLELDMQVSDGGTLQVFWRKALASFSQHNSAKIPLYPGMQHAYSIPLGSGDISSLRIDPTNSKADISISQISLSSPFRRKLWDDTEGFKDWKVQENISSSVIKDNKLLIQANNDDPFFINEHINLDRAELRYEMIALLIMILILAFVVRLQFDITNLYWQSIFRALALKLDKSFLGRILQAIDGSISEAKLIVFDYRAIIFLLVSTMLFCSLVFFKVHYSSMHAWNFITKSNQGLDTLLLGKPRPIRSDEWSTITPNILSQLNSTPPLAEENLSLGKGKVPLIGSLPVRHYSSLFQPQNWGFFIFDTERGYSFWWNFKLFGVLVSVFLLLMLLTKSAFWLSLTGALWFLYSGFSQWWFSTALPDIVSSFSLGVVAVTYVLFSSKAFNLTASFFFLVIFAINFALSLYPPFQIPFVYLGMVLILGFILCRFSRQDFCAFLYYRLALLLGGWGLVVLILILFCQDAFSTIELIQQTAYPGKRLTSGGDFEFLNYFIGFFDSFASESFFSSSFANVCEASSFYLLWPLLALVYLYKASKKREFFRLEAFLLLYLLGLSFYLFVGIPDWLARISFWHMVPAVRTILATGFASILLVCVWLSHSNSDFYLSKKESTWLCFLLFFVILELAHQISEFNGNVFVLRQIWGVAISITLLSYLLLRGKQFYFAALILCFTLFPNFLINPIVKGLDVVSEQEIVQSVKEFADTDKASKWIVFDNEHVANLVKIAGVQVFNGLKFTPDLDAYKLLDPSGENNEIYNRFARIVYHQSKAGEPIRFELIRADTFGVYIDPCAEELRQLGVRYYIFDGQPQKPLSCLRLLKNEAINGQYWLYQRKQVNET